MPEIANKDEKCRRIEALIESGRGVCESCREIGISEKTFYRWRKAQSLGEIEMLRSIDLVRERVPIARQ